LTEIRVAQGLPQPDPVTGGDLPVQSTPSRKRPTAADDIDLAVRFRLQTASIQNDRVELLNNGTLDRKAFVNLPPSEHQAVLNLAQREECQKTWSKQLGVKIQNSDEFYLEDGVHKVRVKP
jgi:hypothetical protein